MTCKDCGQNKPEDAFYKHPAMARGILNQCKECKKAYQRTHHQLKMKDPAWVTKERARQVAKVCSPVGMARMRRYRKEYPERYAAHRTLNHAVRDGKIIKPETCERCGLTERLHGHHADYSRPLEVEWLCAKCHSTERDTQ
jgi:ribosomal protein S27AE